MRIDERIRNMNCEGMIVGLCVLTILLFCGCLGLQKWYERKLEREKNDRKL